MKKIVVGVVASVLGGLLISTVAFAQAQQPAPPPGHEGSHPCKAVEQACQAAGFVRGGATAGKGLVKDCMKPLLNGQSVPGVTVDPATLQACQARKAEWQSKHKQPPPPPPAQ